MCIRDSDHPADRWAVFERRFEPHLPAVRFKPRGILDNEVHTQPGSSIVKKLCAFGGIGDESLQLRTLSHKVVPRGPQQPTRRVGIALGSGNVKEPLKHQVHQGAQAGGALRGLRNAVDHPQPVQVGALGKVIGSGRGKAGGARHGTSVGRESDTFSSD